jgi:hypothetical protein
MAQDRVVSVANLMRLASAANRLNLLLDERALQADLVRADRIFPIASLAGSADGRVSADRLRAVLQ